MARPGGPQQLLSRTPLSSLTPSGSATKTPLGIFPPAPMRRSPGHTLMLCGLFWGVAVWLHPLVGTDSMTSSSRSFEASGARARFAAAFTAMRLLWLMTSVVSGHPGLEGKSSFSLALACSSVGHAADPQPFDEVEDAGVGAHVLRELVPVPAGRSGCRARRVRSWAPSACSSRSVSAS